MLGMFAIAFGVVGCGNSGPKLSPVSGKVTYEGKPIASGMVRFSNPQAGVDIMATIQPNGTYRVQMAKGNGLPEGTYVVAIMPPRANTPIGATTATPQPPRPDIPDKYRQPSTSGLTLTVKPGDNPFDIHMQPDK